MGDDNAKTFRNSTGGVIMASFKERLKLICCKDSTSVKIKDLQRR